MGRKTFESIGRPLPNRENFVISSNKILVDGIKHYKSLRECLENIDPNTNPFVIGGARLFEESLPLVERAFVTWIDENFEGDVFFPKYDFKANFKAVKEETFQNPFPHRFTDYQR
jgi:dihydrofolate reductase